MDWVIGKFWRRMGYLFKKDFSDETIKSLTEFVKFGIVGVSNSIVNYAAYAGSLVLLNKVHLLEGRAYFVAQIVAFLISVLWAFFWNNKFVFTEERRNGKEIVKALFKTYASYALTGLVLSEILLEIWINIVGISELIAPIINILICLPLNFFLNKLWAFKSINS